METMENKKQINFIGYDCNLVFGKYGSNNQNYIQLVDANDGEAVCTASVALPLQWCIDNDCVQGDDEVFIKDYSENTGILEALVSAGVISVIKPIRLNDYVEVAKCKIIKK